jgi:hypothetical protein
VACPHVLEISSVAHQLSCFEVELSLCWFIEGLFLCLARFLWDKVRDPSTSSLLSACYAGLLIVFQFCYVVWLWMLLTGSGDELCGPYLPYFRQQLITHPLLALLLFHSLFTESSSGDQLLAPPPFSGALRAPHPFCCMFLFSSLFIIQVFFLWGGGLSLSRRLCWFISGVAVGIPHATYFLTCWSAESLPSRFGAGIWWCRSPLVSSV